MKSVKRVNRSKKMLWYALKKREDDGECCQQNNEQDNAEQLTYEYTVKIPEQKQIVNE